MTQQAGRHNKRCYSRVIVIADIAEKCHHKKKRYSGLIISITME